MTALLTLLGPRHAAAAERVASRYEAEAARALAFLPGAAPEPVPPHVCHCLPWLFAEVFPGVEDEALCQVAVSGLLYQAHVLTLDRVIDGDDRADGRALLAGSLLHERALTLLFPLLPPDTSAWERLAGYVREYATAVLQEKRHHGRVGPYPWARFEEIARGKAAILKASPMMVACMAGRADRVPEIEAVLDPYSLAVQVQDDLEDWRADYAAGRHSHLLTEALESLGGAGEGAGRPSVEEVGHALFHGGLAERALARAAAACAESEARAVALGAPDWAGFAGLFRARLEELVGGFERVRRRAVAAGAGPDDVRGALARAFARLDGERAGGYRESWHSMGFAHDQGFTGASEVQHGTVFQRAVLGWLFALAERAGQALPPGAVDENLEALEGLRRTGERGGWSYFPDLPELAPDSDDLAQVIHAVCARPTPARLALLEEPVALVLGHHRHASGAVDTWLIDPAAPPARQERYRTWIARAWGRGTDPEVVANFFSALHALDPEGHAEAVRAGAAYVAGCQEEDGSWTSSWYVGPYYGTWTACRLLRAVDPAHPALARARAFLERTRRPDGGWGAAERSTPLQTALGLLALTEAGGPGARALARDAVRHLLLVQRADGMWSRDPLIRMNLRRSDPAARAQWIFHGSGTLTTAFACAALLGAAAPEGPLA